MCVLHKCERERWSDRKCKSKKNFYNLLVQSNQKVIRLSLKHPAAHVYRGLQNLTKALNHTHATKYVHKNHTYLHHKGYII